MCSSPLSTLNRQSSEKEVWALAPGRYCCHDNYLGTQVRCVFYVCVCVLDSFINSLFTRIQHTRMDMLIHKEGT